MKLIAEMMNNSTITLLKMTLQIACYVIGTTGVADTMNFQPTIPE
jgi:hypothetical protein